MVWADWTVISVTLGARVVVPSETTTWKRYTPGTAPLAKRAMAVSVAPPVGVGPTWMSWGSVAPVGLATRLQT